MSTSNTALLRAIALDRALGSSILFSHRHAQDSPSFHVEVMDLWRAEDELVLIEAFRGAAKSTLSEEFLLMEGCFGNFFYTLLIGETYAKACQRLDDIAYEGTHNTKLMGLFGSGTWGVFEKKPIENKVVFRNTGAMVEAIGWEQEVRSFKHHGRRPDRSYLDDVENLERVRSTEAVDATMHKLYREIFPAMDIARRKIRVTQTPLAADCMVTRIRSSPGWVCRSFPVASGDLDDPKTKSAWPSRLPMEWIRAERDNYAAAGKLADFMQEYMLKVDDVEVRPFTEDMIQYADMAPAAWLPRYAIYDPARSTQAGKSDRTGKVVVSRMGSKIIVHESDGAYWKPDETRTDIFAVNDRHAPAEIAVEKNSLDEYLMQPIRFEMLRRGVTLPVRSMNAPQDRDKKSFIMGLHPFFSAKDVILVGGRSAHQKLVAEILNFPAGSLDILNALAYAPRVFAGRTVYEDFSDANIAPAPEPGAGATVYAAWNSNGSETVCVAAVRSGRHIFVARDWVSPGPVLDAARFIAVELRAAYPMAQFSTWVPAELHDQTQRIALVPALRQLKFTPYRGEHIATARGCLAERMRTAIRQRRLLTVDQHAKTTLAALAGGYKFAIDKSGADSRDPAQNLSRIAAETLETMVSVLDQGAADANPGGAHYARNAEGHQYMTSLPRRQ